MLFTVARSEQFDMFLFALALNSPHFDSSDCEGSNRSFALKELGTKS